MITLRDDHARWIGSQIARLFEPPSRAPISQWCEQHMVIPPPQTEMPGPFTLSGREYLREILDSCSAPGVRDIMACLGSQAGKTTMEIALVIWVLANDPSMILWVTPSIPFANTFSQDRLQPIIKATPETEKLIPRGVGRHGFQTLKMRLGGSVLYLTGANSPANVKSKPIRVLIADEIEDFYAGGSRDTDTLTNAEQRTKRFSRPLRVKTSTPKLSDGPAWREFEKGDMRRRWVPCPLCSKFVLLIWSKEFTYFPLTGDEAVIQWDREAKRADGSWDLDRVARSTRALCPHCGGHIQDAAKTKMDRGGVYRPTSKAQKGFRSWHLSSLYVPGPETAWGTLAMRFVQMRTIPERQGFVNGTLAEPWENQEGRSRRVEVVVASDEKPIDGATLIQTVDVQAVAPFFWVTVRAWQKGGNSRLVWAGHCDQWETVRAIQLHHKVVDELTIIDSGHASATVYEQCLRFGRAVPQRAGMPPMWLGWIPSQGRGGQDTRWLNERTKQPQPFHVASAAHPDSSRIDLPLLQFSSDWMMDWLAKLRRGPTNAGGVAWELVPLPVPIPVPGAVPVGTDEYFRHMDGEIYTPLNVVRGVARWGWKPRSSRWPNHLLDTEKMQVAAAVIRRLLPYSAQTTGNAATT